MFHDGSDGPYPSILAFFTFLYMIAEYCSEYEPAVIIVDGEDAIVEVFSFDGLYFDGDDDSWVRDGVPLG